MVERVKCTSLGVNANDPLCHNRNMSFECKYGNMSNVANHLVDVHHIQDVVLQLRL